MQAGALPNSGWIAWRNGELLDGGESIEVACQPHGRPHIGARVLRDELAETNSITSP